MANQRPASTAELSWLPEELAERLVVGDGFVVVLSEAILDVFKAPLLHQLAGGFGLLRKHRQKETGILRRGVVGDSGERRSQQARSSYGRCVL